VLLADTALATRKIRAQQFPFTLLQVLSARVRAVGSLSYYLGYHLLRYYLLPFLLVALFYPPAGVLLLGVAGGVGLVDYRVRKPRMSLPAFYLYHFLEQLAYGTGVFLGLSANEELFLLPAGSAQRQCDGVTSIRKSIVADLQVSRVSSDVAGGAHARRMTAMSRALISPGKYIQGPGLSPRSAPTLQSWAAVR